MVKPNFENLRIDKLAEDLAHLIWDLVSQWDRFAKETVGPQVVCAADSVGANLAQGTGRGSVEDNGRFAKRARGSLNKTQHFLRRAFGRKLLTVAEVKKSKPLVDNLAPPLNFYIKSIGPTATED